MTKINPDISHYHPVKNWKKAKENCNFLISKATQRCDFIDSTLKDFVKKCEEYKIPYWLYCFPEKGIEVESVQFFWKTVKPLIGPYCVGFALDVETDNKGKLVTPEGVEKAMKLLKSYGYKTMIYTDYHQYDKWKNVIAKVIDKDCAWWEARYGKNIGGKDYSADYPCHSAVELHQFTSTFVCDYFTGGVDLSKIRNIAGKDLSWYTTPLKKSVSVEAVTNTPVLEAYPVQKVIDVALAEVGYVEKKSNSNLDSKTANKGSNNYTKYWRDLKPSYQAQPWCDCFVDWCFQTAYGKTKAQEMLCGGLGEFYTPSSAQYFKNKGQWSSKPAIGAQIFFKNSSRICHTGIVYKFDSKKVYTIEGNTSNGEFNAEGGAVCKKSYDLNNSRIAGYGIVKYDSKELSTTPVSNKKTYEQVGGVLPKAIHSRGYWKKNDNTEDTKRVKKFLLWVYPKSGITVKTGLYGDNTVKHVKKFQNAVGIEVDGKWGKQTQAKAKEYRKG